MVVLPKGFYPQTFDQLLAYYGQGLGEMLYTHLQLPGPVAMARIVMLEHQGLIQFVRDTSGDPGVFTAPEGGFPSETDLAFAHKLVSFWDVQGNYDANKGVIVGQTDTSLPTLPPHSKPHWQQALDMKLSAIKSLKFIERLPADSHYRDEVNWLDLQEDLNAIRVADVFSFSAETMHAIRTGMESIPHESSLKSVELPAVKAGWFWFAEPFPVVSSPVASDNTAALLWSWGEVNGMPCLRFSAYCLDEKGRLGGDHMVPSTKWLWPLDRTFHEMIGINHNAYKLAYGPGGVFAHQKNTIGAKGTLKAVAELSLFFLMSCVWFRQTVPGTTKKVEPTLTLGQGHIERHAKKRAQKELKLDAPPVVRVVALRRSAAVEHVEPSGESKHHLTVRFVVAGHARLQPCGPGRVDRKLIWIDSFIKGPNDAPLKPTSPRVYAVVR